MAEKYSTGYQIGTWPQGVEEIKRTVEEAVGEGATLIRYQIVDPTRNANAPTVFETIDYGAFWDEKIEDFIEVVNHCKLKNLDVKFVLDMHTAPYGVKRTLRGDVHNIFTQDYLLWEWANMWRGAIERLKHNKAESFIAAYDLINEPAYKNTQVMWDRFYTPVIRYLRRVTDKPFILAATRSEKKWRRLVPIGDRNVWYTAHFYEPHEIAFYGVLEKYNDARYLKAKAQYLKASDEISGKIIISEAIKDFKDFISKNKLIGYVGEIGVSAKVKDDFRALVVKDTLTLFNRRKLKWTFHALNESAIWQPSGLTKKAIMEAMR